MDGRLLKWRGRGKSGGSRKCSGGKSGPGFHREQGNWFAVSRRNRSSNAFEGTIRDTVCATFVMTWYPGIYEITNTVTGSLSGRMTRSMV